MQLNEKQQLAVDRAAEAAAPGQSFDDMGNAAKDEEIPF